MDETHVPYHLVNFWLLDLTASFLVFVSAWYGKISRRRITDEIGDYPITPVKEKKLAEGAQTAESFCEGSLRLLILYTIYFLTMAASVVLFQWYSFLIIFFQHITVIFCIFVTFYQWLQPRLALFVGGTFSTLWFMSGTTTFRWVLNDIVIAFFGLLVGGNVHFKSFPSLQIFLWLAVVYDVCLVKNVYQGVPSLLSAGQGEKNCETVFCKAFEISDAWELPTIFTFKLGLPEEYVYLGAGDIIIGCIVSNFSQMFFRSSKYLSATVLTYAIAIALLSQVGDEPYPALVTIVPLCSFQLVLSAILSNKTKNLFSFKCLESAKEREGHDMNILL
ncbi:uncharacterized protein LOC111339006 [Stylophora pistillata]|uniref:uncharacterized protein LOC111339006 n=1 Tax=Stylophora pistillata TaxID=50429 RepID=UPI000C04A777|nr:uncharacterized protein LOC111339006 [Stylophora pistillata]